MVYRIYIIYFKIYLCPQNSINYKLLYFVGKNCLLSCLRISRYTRKFEDKSRILLQRGNYNLQLCKYIYIHFIYLINELNTDLGGWGADFIAYRHAYQPPVLYTAFLFRQKTTRKKQQLRYTFWARWLCDIQNIRSFFTASEQLILNRFSTFKVS